MYTVKSTHYGVPGRNQKSQISKNKNEKKKIQVDQTQAPRDEIPGHRRGSGGGKQNGGVKSGEIGFPKEEIRSTSSSLDERRHVLYIIGVN